MILNKSFYFILIVLIVATQGKCSFNTIEKKLNDYLALAAESDSFDIDDVFKGLCPLLLSSNQYSKLFESINSYSTREEGYSQCVDSTDKIKKIYQILNDMPEVLTPNQSMFYHCILQDFLNIIKVSSHCKATNSEQAKMFKEFLIFLNEFIN